MIVITGGAGFIGSILLERLNQMGHEDILVVDQRAPATMKAGLRHSKWENLKNRKFKLYLESGEFLKRLENGSLNGSIQAVFHLGASTDTTEMNRAYLKENNTEYSKRLAEWALKSDVYFAYASSAAVYGDGALGFSDDDALTVRLKALNPYGQSKLDFDLWILKNAYEKKITGFRFFNVYGPNEYHKGLMRSVVHKGFVQIHSTGKIRLFKSYKTEYPDGGQKRDFIYVKDAVEAMLWFYKNPKWKGIYNLGRGVAQTWNELAQALFRAMERPVNIEYIEMPENLRNQYQYFTEADLTKLKKTGCPVSFRDLESGVADYVKNYLALP